MSGNKLYDPTQVALDTVTEPWSEALRAQRDVGLLIPINFHVVPAISLKAACFNNNVYSDRALQKCFSNLLAVGLRRFNIDLYWDQVGSQWSLCPAERAPPGSDPNMSSSSYSSTSAPDSTSRPTTSSSSSGSPSTTLAARGTTVSSSSLLPSTILAVQPRQTTSSSATVSASSTLKPGNIRIEMSPYNCTGSLTLDYMTDILSDFLKQTATTTDASVTFLLLNLHAAAPRSSPSSPAQRPTELPNPGNFISDIIKSNLSSDIYTPKELEAQRADLDDNKSWFSGDPDSYPASGYYETHQKDDKLATSDGWPTDAFLVFRETRRLVVSFGTIDPQMSDYNLTVDAPTIFPSNTTREPRPVTFNTDGTVSSGCLSVPSESKITKSTNSSWVVAPVPDINIGTDPDLQVPISVVGNLTSCGLSPFLNKMLANTTADQNPLPYAAFARSYIWTFAPGEPSNATSQSNTFGRCTAMNINGPHRGRWRTVDCTTPLRAACQDPSVPYHWEISSERSSYGKARSPCPSGLRFSVPHTALENSHLYAAALASSSSSSSSSSQNNEPILLDLNSLDVEDCWVSGENSTCPYLPPADTDRTRVVVVPTVAAVLIFVCAALTFFVKCAANRREDKRGRRRRMVGGWEYEGVPS